MTRDPAYLLDMLHAARDIRERCLDIDVHQFSLDRTRQYAMYYLFTVIGEAARRLSAATHARYPDPSWHRMIGMRNRLVHEYGRVNVVRVWETARDDIPILTERLEAILANELRGDDTDAELD